MSHFIEEDMTAKRYVWNSFICFLVLYCFILLLFKSLKKKLRRQWKAPEKIKEKVNRLEMNCCFMWINVSKEKITKNCV